MQPCPIFKDLAMQWKHLLKYITVRGVLGRDVPDLSGQLQEVRGCGRIPRGLRISRGSTVGKLRK